VCDFSYAWGENRVGDQGVSENKLALNFSLSFLGKENMADTTKSWGNRFGKKYAQWHALGDAVVAGGGGKSPGDTAR
jgi:hypothetical protein